MINSSDYCNIVCEQLFRVGPDPALGFEIEQELEDWLLKISRKGAPIPVDGLCYSVQHICQQRQIETPFTNDVPGRKWVAGFFKRHPILSVKKSEYLSKQRALLTEGTVRGWFMNVRRQLEEDGIDLSMLEDPKRVFNLDETAIYTNPAGKVSCWYLEAQNHCWTTNEKRFLFTIFRGIGNSRERKNCS